MKKKIITGLLAVAMMFGLAGCASAPVATPSTEADPAQTQKADGETAGLKLGVAVQTLGNQVWAQQMDAIQKSAEEDGNMVTVVDCNENANTQISQIENFITSGIDVLIVNPVDANAIEEVCKRAQEEGIKVVAWDEEMTNADMNWIIKNYDLGAAIGEQAAKFINEKFPEGTCEVAVLGYPQTPILLERENGIIDKLKELAPKAVIAANQPAINPTEGLDAMQTILQANPDVKIVCSIGGGGAAGANEALKGTYDTVPADVGIFSTDLTDETIASMENGEYNRVCIAITGNAYVCGETIYDLAARLGNGEKMEKNVYRDLVPVSVDNLSEMK